MQNDQKPETPEKPAEGRIVQAGWISYMTNCIDKNLSQWEELDLQSAFFAGALTVFNEFIASINNADLDVTRAAEELKRLGSIGREITEFTQRLNEMAADLLKSAGGRKQ
jgi:hypothetical protein